LFNQPPIRICLELRRIQMSLVANVTHDSIDLVLIKFNTSFV